MAGGALAVLRGEIRARTYTGRPVWQGFRDCEIRKRRARQGCQDNTVKTTIKEGIPYGRENS